MNRITDRLDLRLAAGDKNRIRRAAALAGMPVAAFVREAALREAEAVMAHSTKGYGVGGLAARLRGRATAPRSTEEIMQLTRGE